MTDRRYGEWDQEPIGFNPQRGRNWSRSRNAYLTLVLGMIGVFLTIGALGHPRLLSLLGALCVLASPVAIICSDGAAKKRADGTRCTPLRTELLWLLSTAVLVVSGALLFDLA